MKKPFKEHFWWLGIILVALVVLGIIGANIWFVYDFFKGIWDKSETTGMFILDIVKIPFAIFGGIQLFRGFWAIAEKDTANLGDREYWKGVLYIIVTFIGYVALFSLLNNI